jgi:DNA-binding NarL/FixJ family response regulator
LNNPEVSVAKSGIVVAGASDSRMLLRGLLRIQRIGVDGDAEGSQQAMELLRRHHPTLMVVDVHLAEGNPFILISDARTLTPKLKVILVASASDPPNFRARPNIQPDAVLLRPFRIQQFADALALCGCAPAESIRTSSPEEAPR